MITTSANEVVDLQVYTHEGAYRYGWVTPDSGAHASLHGATGIPDLFRRRLRLVRDFDTCNPTRSTGTRRTSASECSCTGECSACGTPSGMGRWFRKPQLPAELQGCLSKLSRDTRAKTRCGNTKFTQRAALWKSSARNTSWMHASGLRCMGDFERRNVDAPKQMCIRNHSRGIIRGAKGGQYYKTCPLL